MADSDEEIISNIVDIEKKYKEGFEMNINTSY